ncbi:hypothetical protein HID58_068332 [Brassica napus]|uniref:Uncharacterized protein n=1 Tax=Brassica napus TaxID=3708 RepID=A0ABQ7ZL87_BRANA|nr:hypothetical protein HID58_068332 [Brassica napus]
MCIAILVVAAGANPALISKGIDKTAEALAHELNIMSKGNKARNNPEAGSMISEAMNKVGKSGVVGAVEEGIVIGGGCTFLGLADKVDHIKDTLENVEEKVSKTFVSFERFAYLWTAFFNCSLDYRLEQTS